MAKTRLGATRCGRRSAARTAKLADGCKYYVNIYPQECENLLITHPKVADAAVFGVPNEDLQRFAENDVSFSILPDLTDQHLKEIGVSLGHRLQLLQAIAELTSREKEAPKPAATTATSAAPQDGAERRQVTVMFADLVARQPGRGTSTTGVRMREFRRSPRTFLRCLAKDGTNSKTVSLRQETVRES
jgi:acyl-CoA synthetase (AMP-forming)/AMP-acid ligase II